MGDETMSSDGIVEDIRLPWLHYIGRGTYGRHAAVEEFQRIGVNRAISFGQLSQMKWGDVVYLAEFTPDGRRARGYGNATVFGFFRLSGLNYTLPPEIREYLAQRTVTSCTVVTYGLDDRVVRQCGSYNITGHCTTRDSIEDIINAIKLFCDENNLNPNSYNYFLAGTFHQIEPSIRFPLYFYRGYAMQDVPILSVESGTVDETTMDTLGDYRRE